MRWIPPPLLKNAVDLVRVIAMSRRVEAKRRTIGPTLLLRGLRERGQLSRRRSDADRARLKWIIGMVDRHLCREGANCYRRVLIEIALDAGAAAEPVRFGLMAGGDPGSGHAYFASEAGPTNQMDTRYDVIFVM